MIGTYHDATLLIKSADRMRTDLMN